MKYQLFADASMDTAMGTYVGAVGVVVQTNLEQFQFSSLVPAAIKDANRAEEYAIYRAIKWFKVSFPYEGAKLLVYTDSDHAVRNFKCSHAQLLLQEMDIKYELKLVCGHKQHSPIQLANEMAHNLAVRTMRAKRDKVLNQEMKNENHQEVNQRPS